MRSSRVSTCFEARRRFPGGAPAPGTPEFRVRTELKDLMWSFNGKEPGGAVGTKRTGTAQDRARHEARRTLAHELGEASRIPGSGKGRPLVKPSDVGVPERAPDRAPAPAAQGRGHGARSDPAPAPWSSRGQFHRKTNTYRAQPGNAQRAIANLTTAGFMIDVGPGVRAAIEDAVRRRVRAVEAADARAVALDAKLRLEGGELFAHQFEGIRWLADRLEKARSSPFACRRGSSEAW